MAAANRRVELFFEEQRRELKSRVFDTLTQTQRLVESVLVNYVQAPDRVVQLTAYPYIKNTSQLLQSCESCKEIGELWLGY